MYSRHKVFISCYYADDGKYKQYLQKMNDLCGIFIDCSVQEYDIDDTGLSSEQIRRIIRDDYIRDSTVTIVLCGPNTRCRKHVDWEIHATMYDSAVNHQGGLLVINTPESNNDRIVAVGDQKLVNASHTYSHYYGQDWLDEHFEDLPDRLFWNIVNGVPISIVDWKDVQDPYILHDLIENAYIRKFTNMYDTRSLPLRKRNSCR